MRFKMLLYPLLGDDIMERKRPIVSNIIKDVYVPKMFKVKQHFSHEKLDHAEIPAEITNLLSSKKFAEKIRPGMKIAITAGSRGIANIPLIIRTIVDFVKSKGALPFIVPAMGSHGGATAEGQKAVLQSLGISEETMGCPIRSSMTVKNIGKNDEGTDVFIDKNAAEADGIIICCRIKPHTGFRGKYESGIMKMMAIGLGKQHGAEVCHAEGLKNMAKNIPLFGKTILKHSHILFAVASLENAFDETRKIIVLDADEIEEEEPHFLKESFQYMPHILVDACDVLVVDQIGKNYAGSGMDPNITGTFSTPYVSGGIKAQQVCVLDISSESHGNAMGIGNSNATTTRVFNQIDLAAMYPNAITAKTLGAVRIPIVMESDKEAIQVCIKACTEIDEKSPRIVRIPNSLQIEHIWLSESYYEEAMSNPNLTIESEPDYMPFDENGNLF